MNKINLLIFLLFPISLIAVGKEQKTYAVESGIRYQLAFEAKTSEGSTWELQVVDAKERKLLDGNFREFYQMFRPGDWEKYRQIFCVPKDGEKLYFSVQSTVETRNITLEKVPDDPLNPNSDFTYGLHDFTAYGKSRNIEIVENEKGQRVIRLNPRGSIVTDPIPVKGIKTLWLPHFWPCSMHIAFLDDDMCFVGELTWQGNGSFNIPEKVSWLIASVCRTSGNVNEPVNVRPIKFMREDPKKK